MIDCLPQIGVVVANGLSVESAYVQIQSDKLPPLSMLLETLVAVLSWLDVSTGEIRTVEWTHADCTPRDALHSEGLP